MFEYKSGCYAEQRSASQLQQAYFCSILHVKRPVESNSVMLGKHNNTQTQTK